MKPALRYTLLLACAAALPVAAQEMKHEMPAMQTAQSSPSTPSTPRVHGEIRKIDVDAGKLTIRHGAIPNLDMPAMTMVFRAASPELLNKIKAGDQVLFSAEKNNGALTVTAIDIAPEK